MLGRLAHTNREVIIEYDGGYWHSLRGAPERDLLKTQALLDAGCLVVRIRENELPHVPLYHPRLLQLDFIWGSEDDAMLELIGQIEYWLNAHQLLEV